MIQQVLWKSGEVRVGAAGGHPVFRGGVDPDTVLGAGAHWDNPVKEVKN